MVTTPENDNQTEEPHGGVEEAERWRLRQESESNQSVNEVRSKIHVLLDFFVNEGLATEQTVGEYRAAAEVDQSLDEVTGFHHWIVEKRFMAIRVLKEIETEIGVALAENLLSEKDRDGLIERLVLTGDVDFVGQAGVIQGAVHEELEQMRIDRGEFDALSENELIEEGVLVVEAGKEIKIPDLKGFLEMSVEGRRQFLGELRKSLPKAEHHQEREDRVEGLRLEKEFHGLLAQARKEGVIGFQVIQRFMGLFRKLENEGKGETIEALDEILEPYVELWEEIRETLEGGPLMRLEGLRDLLNHEQLRAQFERTVVQECLRLDWEYSHALDRAVVEKVLPSRVRREWGEAMRSEDLEGKRERLESLDEELEPYAELREEIDELEDPEQVRQLNSMFAGELFGFEEIRERMDELSGMETEEAEEAEGPDEQSMKLLFVLDRDQVKDAIVEASEELDFTQKKRLVERLNHYLHDKLSHEYKDYEENVKDAWVEQKKAVIKQSDWIKGEEEEHLLENEEILEDESDEIVLPIHSESMAETQADAESEEVKVIEVPEPEEEANEEGTFEEFIYLDEEDEEEDTRVVKMEIADGEAVDVFNSNDLLNEKNDKLSLMTGGEEYDVELDLRESRVLVDFLEADIKKHEKAAA